MIVLLVHSKSKALLSASRTRGSANFRRLVLMNQPCAPDGVSSGISSRTTRPSFTAKKSSRVAKTGEIIPTKKRKDGGEQPSTPTPRPLKYPTRSLKNFPPPRPTGRPPPHQPAPRRYSI